MQSGGLALSVLSRFASGGRRPKLGGIAAATGFLCLLLLSAAPNADPAPAEGCGAQGQALAATGHYSVEGAPYSNVKGVSEAGHAYVYSAVGHRLLDTLTSPSPTNAGHFGISVAVSGDLVAVDGDQETSNGTQLAGEVFVYDAKDGKLLSKLTSPNPIGGGHFGLSVAVAGEDVAVGACGETSGEQKLAGNAYLFEATTGKLFVTLNSPNAQEGARFGWSVAASGEKVVVGAPYSNPNGVTEAGNAYVYNTETGNLIRTLTSPSPQQSGVFGYAVAVSGDEVAVSEPEQGHVYLFSASTGKLAHTLTNPKASESASLRDKGGFGNSVYLRGEGLIVGAPYDNANGVTEAGDAYVYSAETGAPVRTLTSRKPTSDGHYGISVGAGGEIGATGEGTGAGGRGAGTGGGGAGTGEGGAGTGKGGAGTGKGGAGTGNVATGKGTATLPHASENSAPRAGEKTASHAVNKAAPHAVNKPAPHAAKKPAPEVVEKRAPRVIKKPAPPPLRPLPELEGVLLGSVGGTPSAKELTVPAKQPKRLFTPAPSAVHLGRSSSGHRSATAVDVLGLALGAALLFSFLSGAFGELRVRRFVR